MSLMKIFAISGDGIGAGKSTLAKKLGQEVWSLAGALRQELKNELPNYDWFNKSQEYKEVRVKERNNRTIRTLLIERGQIRCQEDDLYWVRKIADKLVEHDKFAGAAMTVAIDDIRKVNEIEHLKEKLPGQVIHFHVCTNSAKEEPEFQNDELRQMADYIIVWE
jgi:hypothetical protein